VEGVAVSPRRRMICYLHDSWWCIMDLIVSVPLHSVCSDQCSRGSRLAAIRLAATGRSSSVGECARLSAGRDGIGAVGRGRSR
jgi:hypothetical protein